MFSKKAVNRWHLEKYGVPISDEQWNEIEGIDLVLHHRLSPGQIYKLLEDSFIAESKEKEHISRKAK